MTESRKTMTVPRMLVIQKAHVEFLRHLLQVSKIESGVADRARILLLRGEGLWTSVVAQRIGCDPTTVWRIERRYCQEGLQALHDRPRSGRPRTISPPATGIKLVVQESKIAFISRARGLFCRNGLLGCSNRYGLRCNRGCGQRRS